MRTINSNRQRLHKIIKQDGDCILQLSPIDLDEFERQEKELIYSDPDIQHIQQSVKYSGVGVGDEEIDLSGLSGKPLQLFNLYVSDSMDNCAILSNSDAAKMLECSIRTIQRAKAELIKNEYIRCFYNRERKQYELEILDSQ